MNIHQTFIQPLRTGKNCTRSLTPQAQRTRELFRENFPTSEAVLQFFHPDNWPFAISKASALAALPCLTLAEVDEAFECDGLACNIVCQQIKGIYMMSAARQEYNAHATQMAASMFVAQYGHVCSLFAMLIYFGQYTVKYKTTFTPFDISDVLGQYEKKFMGWWRDREAEAYERQQPQEKTESSAGNNMAYVVRCWLLRGETAEHIRSRELFKRGYIKEAHIREAQAEVAAGVF